MAKICICDICGRTDASTDSIKKCKKLADSNFRKRNKQIFDDRPLKITVPNYEGNKYTVFVDVKIEDARDTKKIDDFYNNKQAIIDGFIAQLFQPQMMDEESMGCACNTGGQQGHAEMGIGIDFANPHPHICAYCKREMLKLAMTYGDEEIATDFLE